VTAAESNLVNAQSSGNPALIQQAAEFLNDAKNKLANAPRKAEQADIILQDCQETGICVNCRYRMGVGETPSFKGDRILVMKFPYELPDLPGSSGPQRWDVVVFHRPEGPEINYIKRLVGLPGETLRISHGDIFRRPTGSDAPFEIQRKLLIHQQAMQMLVYDDHYRPKALKGKPEWNRWNPTGSCKETTEGHFTINGESEADWSSLRYRHLLPDPEQWAAIESKTALPRAPRPTLITDFYSYNTAMSAQEPNWNDKSIAWLQHNWVGDLTISCRVEVEGTQPGAMARFELVEAGISNRCEVDLGSGVASLYHGDKKLGESGTLIRGTGAHDVAFANVDDRLTFWVDGQTVFEEGIPYDDGPEVPYVPTEKDLDPVGVSFKAAKATVSDLVLKRDIYYTQRAGHVDYQIPGTDDYSEPRTATEYAGVNKMFDFLSDPSKFPALKNLPYHDYKIRPNHFMMLGDNSPHSSDSREWHSEDIDWRVEERSNWEVPRSLLIGKAFFIYWPHGKPFGPDGRINRDWRVPFRPYFERMKWIR
jgi:signal peptidase I